MGEACRRIIDAEPGQHLEIIRPFKKLVPCFLGDIVTLLLRSSTLSLPESISPLFTVASQEGYIKEDALLHAVAESLNVVRGEQREYDIEPLPVEDSPAFSYDLTKVRKYLLRGRELTPLTKGLEQHLRWLLESLARG